MKKSTYLCKTKEKTFFEIRKLKCLTAGFDISVREDKNL
jgi:hypothetical protein